MKQGIQVSMEQIRGCRLAAHHLKRKMPAAEILTAAGACGLQNSPPGAWETALFQRLEHETLDMLHTALYEQKILMQAWSLRGVPMVFPAEQGNVFLSPLMAREGEEPWIYTRGITLALDYLGMSFEELLPLIMEAAAYLDSHTVTSKEKLDQVLAEIAAERLPKEKLALWNGPSMYGNPDRQTVGGAVVSFLLRPCSFAGLVVFGRREGSSPTFTSWKNWTGQEMSGRMEGEKELVRKYLHCYGPATVSGFSGWLGCSPRQAKRLWNGVSEEMEPVSAEGLPGYMLTGDIKRLVDSEADEDQILLLGAHDPYLELRDRQVILQDSSLHKLVWRTVSNPGAVLKGGRIVGIWKTKKVKTQMEMDVSLFETISERDRRKLMGCGEEYAAFRGLNMKRCTIGD